MRRILLLVGLAMLMAAMVLANAVPALAASPSFYYNDIYAMQHYYPSAKDCNQAQANDPDAASRCKPLR
jgi:hypothetical protein